MSDERKTLVNPEFMYSFVNFNITRRITYIKVKHNVCRMSKIVSEAYNTNNPYKVGG